jgi:hypothetical protein
LEICQRWFLLGFFGIQNAILGAHLLANDDNGLEIVGSSEMQYPLCGLCFKIVFGRHTIYISRDGKIVEIANFATKLKNRPCIISFIAGTSISFGQD